MCVVAAVLQADLEADTPWLQAWLDKANKLIRQLPESSVVRKVPFLLYLRMLTLIFTFGHRQASSSRQSWRADGRLDVDGCVGW